MQTVSLETFNQLSMMIAAIDHPATKGEKPRGKPWSISFRNAYLIEAVEDLAAAERHQIGFTKQKSKRPAEKMQFVLLQ